MKYREFLNTLSDDDFAEVISTDGIYNQACVDNYSHGEQKCPYGYDKCKECVLRLLQSEIEDTQD